MATSKKPPVSDVQQSASKPTGASITPQQADSAEELGLELLLHQKGGNKEGSINDIFFRCCAFGGDWLGEAMSYACIGAKLGATEETRCAASSLLAVGWEASRRFYALPAAIRERFPENDNRYTDRELRMIAAGRVRCDMSAEMAAAHLTCDPLSEVPCRI